MHLSREKMYRLTHQLKKAMYRSGFSCAVERHRIHEELTGQELKDS